jgi:hypothetical protein
MDSAATAAEGRAYGGVLRSTKGTLVEWIAYHMSNAAWQHHLGQPGRRIRVTSKADKTETTGKRFWVPIRRDYAARPSLNERARAFVKATGDKAGYWTGADVHVFIDGDLALPIECKAYAEIAMLKRILVDATLLREATGVSTYVLLQLENMLGGDYGRLPDFPAGSISGHTMMSYFADVRVEVVTLVAGDRKVDRPIHKAAYYKALEVDSVMRGIAQLAEVLRPYV